MRIHIEIPDAGRYVTLNCVNGVWHSNDGELITDRGLDGLKEEIVKLGMAAYWWGVREKAKSQPVRKPAQELELERQQRVGGG